MIFFFKYIVYKIRVCGNKSVPSGKGITEIFVMTEGWRINRELDSF